MEKIKIDLLREKYQIPASPKKPFVVFGRVLLSMIVFASVAGATMSYNVSASSDASGFPRFSLFSTIRHLVGAGDRLLKGEKDDRINILLLGIGGEGHDGPMLTDTIIFTSYQPSTNDIGMLSVPRDMAVPIPDQGWRKVNHANYFGEQIQEGGGPVLASEVIGDVIGQEINYYVRVDFDGFGKLIDDVGGVDVIVDTTFTDSQYPILGSEYDDCGTYNAQERTNPDTGETETVRVPTYECRYETITFTSGPMHLDGSTALKYVRSRHGNNGEGSDFERAKRQQKVIAGVKEKLMSSGTLLNPARLASIMDTLKENIATNISAWELLQFAGKMKNVDTTKIVNRVLDSSNESPLYATSLNGAYVLLPKNDDWGPVRQMAENIMVADPTSVATTSSSAKKPAASAVPSVRIEIQNGTSISGLAFRASQLLDGNGYDVTKIGNAAERAYKQTVIFDLTNGKKPSELKNLQKSIQAEITLSGTGEIASGTLVPKGITLPTEDPQTLVTAKNIDFLVILGESASNLALK